MRRKGRGEGPPARNRIEEKDKKEKRWRERRWKRQEGMEVEGTTMKGDGLWAA